MPLIPWGEQLVRDVEPFRRFIEVAAQTNGKILSYAKIARDVGFDDKTVESYYAVLEDTLVGFLLEPYVASFRKRLAQKPKFYFFDVGVTRTLARTITVTLAIGTYAYGEAFEHFIILEILRRHGYSPQDFRFSYLRTKDDAEVDLVIERPGRATLLVEIKSSERVDVRDVRKLARLAEDFGSPVEAVILSREALSRRTDEGVLVTPWQIGIQNIVGP